MINPISNIPLNIKARSNLSNQQIISCIRIFDSDFLNGLNSFKIPETF
nr:MAG TPA: hypothetical protein [Caudoviricetes sp.]